MDLDYPATFAQNWQNRMATKMEEAIEQGKTLCTATLLGPGARGVAIFIIESDADVSGSSETECESSPVLK